MTAKETFYSVLQECTKSRPIKVDFTFTLSNRSKPCGRASENGGKILSLLQYLLFCFFFQCPEDPLSCQKQCFADLQYQFSLFKVEAGISDTYDMVKGFGEAS